MKRSSNFEGNLSIHYAFLLMMLTVVGCLPQAIGAQTASGASGTFAAANGTDLAIGDSCYTITSGIDGKEQPIGYVFQSLTTDHVDGVDVMTVIVHQHLLTKKFDM